MRRTSAMAVATIAAAALTLTACGRGDAGSTASETGKDVSAGKATGTITVWAMGAEGENLPKLAKEFEAANPGAKVNVTAIPWDAAYQKFTTAITAGLGLSSAWRYTGSTYRYESSIGIMSRLPRLTFDPCTFSSEMVREISGWASMLASTCAGPGVIRPEGKRYTASLP